MTGNKIRLFKIATEINIGRDYIVEFLKSQGFEVENKPTAELTQEMVDIISEKFKKEKKAHEKQIEKLEKHKQIRKSSAEKTAAKTAVEVPPAAKNADAEYTAVEETPKPIHFKDDNNKNVVTKNNGLSELIQRAVSIDEAAKTQNVEMPDKSDSKPIVADVDENKKDFEVASINTDNSRENIVEAGDRSEEISETAAEPEITAVAENASNVKTEIADNITAEVKQESTEKTVIEETVDLNNKKEETVEKQMESNDKNAAEKVAANNGKSEEETDNLAKYLQEQLTMLGKNEKISTTLDDFENKEVEISEGTGATANKEVVKKKKKKKKKKNEI